MSNNNITNAALAFIGKKFDELIAASKTKVQIDVGKEFTNTASQAVADAFASKEITMAAPIVSLEPLNRNFTLLQHAIEKNNNVGMVKALADIKGSIEMLDLVAPPTDMKEVVKGLKTVAKQIDKIPVTKVPDYSKEFQALGKKLDSLAGKKADFPKEFKLDKMQLAQISTVGGMSVGTPTVATRTTLANVAMTTADTEYSYTFPQGTVSFRMKLRTIGNVWNYSWTTGKLAVSGDASGYISIPAMWLDSRDGISYAGKTIYFESSAATQVMELDIGQL